MHSDRLHERRVKYSWSKPKDSMHRFNAQLQTDINMKEELNIGCASAAWHTSVASVDDEDDSGWSLITTGDFFTGFRAGDGWYRTIVDWSIALQLKRLKELLVLRCVDLLGFCSIPFGVCSIDLVLWSALLHRRSVLFLGILFNHLVSWPEVWKKPEQLASGI